MWCSGLHRSEVAVELLGTFVKAPEEQRSEVKRPDAVADLLEAHVLLGENRADVQPAVVGGDDAIVLPTDAAVAAHAANFEVRGVLHLGEVSGGRTWWGDGEHRRGGGGEGAVRTPRVVRGAEVGEGCRVGGQAR